MQGEVTFQEVWVNVHLDSTSETNESWKAASQVSEPPAPLGGWAPRMEQGHVEGDPTTLAT